jgi:hypothetical protein
MSEDAIGIDPGLNVSGNNQDATVGRQPSNPVGRWWEGVKQRSFAREDAKEAEKKNEDERRALFRNVADIHGKWEELVQPYEGKFAEEIYRDLPVLGWVDKDKVYRGNRPKEYLADLKKNRGINTPEGLVHHISSDQDELIKASEVALSGASAPHFREAYKKAVLEDMRGVAALTEMLRQARQKGKITRDNTPLDQYVVRSRHLNHLAGEIEAELAKGADVKALQKELDKVKKGMFELRDKIKDPEKPTYLFERPGALQYEVVGVRNTITRSQEHLQGDFVSNFLFTWNRDGSVRWEPIDENGEMRISPQTYTAKIGNIHTEEQFQQLIADYIAIKRRNGYEVTSKPLPSAEVGSIAKEVEVKMPDMEWFYEVDKAVRIDGQIHSRKEYYLYKYDLVTKRLQGRRTTPEGQEFLKERVMDFGELDSPQSAYEKVSKHNEALKQVGLYLGYTKTELPEHNASLYQDQLGLNSRQERTLFPEVEFSQPHLQFLEPERFAVNINTEMLNTYGWQDTAISLMELNDCIKNFVPDEIRKESVWNAYKAVAFLVHVQNIDLEDMGDEGSVFLQLTEKYKLLQEFKMSGDNRSFNKHFKEEEALHALKLGKDILERTYPSGSDSLKLFEKVDVRKLQKSAGIKEKTWNSIWAGQFTYKHTKEALAIYEASMATAKLLRLHFQKGLFKKLTYDEINKANLALSRIEYIGVVTNDGENDLEQYAGTIMQDVNVANATFSKIYPHSS